MTVFVSNLGSQWPTSLCIKVLGFPPLLFLHSLHISHTNMCSLFIRRSTSTLSSPQYIRIIKPHQSSFHQINNKSLHHHHRLAYYSTTTTMPVDKFVSPSVSKIQLPGVVKGQERHPMLEKNHKEHHMFFNKAGFHK